MVLLVGCWMGLSFDILIFDCLLKAPQPVAGLFFMFQSPEMDEIKGRIVPLLTLFNFFHFIVFGFGNHVV